MRAVVYREPEKFSVEDVAEPQPGDTDVVVRVERAGVCATDLHLHEGRFFAAFPLTPGHESVGTVSQVGSRVSHVKAGQRVVVDNASACGRCARCSRGDALFCEQSSRWG